MDDVPLKVRVVDGIPVERLLEMLAGYRERQSWPTRQEQTKFGFILHTVEPRHHAEEAKKPAVRHARRKRP